MATAFAAVEIDLDALIDLDEFPIQEVTDPRRNAIVDEVRAQMETVGCFRISSFIRPEAIAKMADEANELMGQAYWSNQQHNPYFSPGDDTLAADHPQQTFQDRQSGFINSDILVSDSLLRQLYDSDVFLHFIYDCLGVDRPIYRWADPLGRNPYGVMQPGHVLPWHFDGNEFTVSVLVQKADSGGVFEYVPNIRNPESENYDLVADVLAGGREGVHTLDLQPGDLQLFAGRFSMHRVTPIEGDTTRVIALPTYVHDPYRMNRPYHSETIYGRATPLHHERALAVVDGLVD